MEEQTKPATVTVNRQDLVATTAVITSTVIVTIGAWHVAGKVLEVPLSRLTAKLKEKSEKHDETCNK